MAEPRISLLTRISHRVRRGARSPAKMLQWPRKESRFFSQIIASSQDPLIMLKKAEILPLPVILTLGRYHAPMPRPDSGHLANSA